MGIKTLCGGFSILKDLRAGSLFEKCVDRLCIVDLSLYAYL